MPHAADRIRNVALVGHRGSGKTSLHEALLFEAGATTRLGSVADGTTVSDADEDEKSRGMSISASLASFEWRDVKVNLIDTPGEPSFIADSLGALRVCESAIFVVNGVMGVEVSTRRLWERAQELHVARLVYVNMLDRERADFFRALDSLKEAFGPHVVATEIPIGSEHELRGLIDLVDMKAYTYDDGECTEIPIPDDLADVAQEYREKLMDEVAENSEALMERYLEGEEISHDEIVHALEEGTDQGHIFPVTCGVATTRLGANRLLDAIVDDLPSPVQHERITVEEGFTLEPDPDGEMFAYVFKTRADPFAGRINLFRVYQGTVTHDTQVMNTRTHHKERVGQLLVPRGKDVSHCRLVRPGRHRRRGEAQGDARRRLAGGARPADPHAADQAPRAGHGVRHGAQEQGRRGQGLHRPAPAAGRGSDDRPAPRRADRRADRGRPVADPRRGDHRPDEVALRRRGDAQAAARALPGDDPGHRPRPTAATRSRPAAAASSATATSRSSRCADGEFEFVNAIKGGVIPHGFIPAVEKGVLEAMQEGSVAGYPVKGVRVRLFDGSYHTVDSSEMAFKLAGSIAMREALSKSSPVLLEPIMLATCSVPDESVGDVMGDLSSRRGRPLGTEAVGGMTEVKAEVPMSEMLSYAPDLRSMTGGQGEYTLEFLRYEEIPAHLAQKVADKAREEAEAVA